MFRERAGILWVSLILVLTCFDSLAESSAPASGPQKDLAPTATPKKEIRVNLFGQPCALTGPVSEGALSALHSISPEQVPPDPDAKTAKAALEKIRTLSGLPAGLDGYRSRLTLRLEAQAAFFDEFEKARKSGKHDGLISLSRKHAAAHKRATLDAAIRGSATSAKLKSKNVTQLRSDLFEAFSEAIEPHPEEEFHRAIRAGDIAYVCTFDDAGGDDGHEAGGAGDADSSADAPAPENPE